MPTLDAEVGHMGQVFGKRLAFPFLLCLYRCLAAQPVSDKSPVELLAWPGTQIGKHSTRDMPQKWQQLG